MRRREGKDGDSVWQGLTGAAQWQGTRPFQNDVTAVLRQGDGRGLCMMIADGIGTDETARMAAEEAIRAMSRAYSGLRPGPNLVTQVIGIAGSAHGAALRVNAQALDRGRMSAGASVGCVMIRGDQMALCSVGNVRVFLFRSGAMLQLNRDFLLSTETETRDVLDGEEPEVDPEMNLRVTAYAGKDGLDQLDWMTEPVQLMPGDRIVMMSSGLYGVLKEAEWGRLLLSRSPQEAAEQVIDRVKERRKQSQSNVSVVIFRAGNQEIG